MIKQKRPHKIALIGDSLSGGGAERVQAALSIYFEQSGISVFHCIFLDQVSYEYRGNVFNLGKINPNGFAPLRKFRRFAALRNFINNNNFSYVIDFRMRTNAFQELLLSMIYPKNTVYTVHSSILHYYFPKPDFVSRMIYKRHKIVAVSDAIKIEIGNRNLTSDVERIYNPIAKSISETTVFKKPDFQYILAVGRMNDDIKQFDKLIAAYAKSSLPSNGIKLAILGEGKYQSSYLKIAEILNLQDFVEFKGFVEDPYSYYKNALFHVLSSKREGLPMVLIEALVAGTPVVGFDCVSGPNEIIQHRKNGLLVNDQDFEALTNAMDELIENTELYDRCKANAASSAGKFSLETIGQQWLDYLKIDVS